MAQTVTGAVASSLLAPFLAQRSSHLEILGVSSDLVWLALDGHALTIQPAAPGSKLALPTSIFCQGETLLAEELSLQRGRLWLRDAPLQVTRWWHPPRALVAPWRGAHGDAPEIEVLLGLGSGLTPEGDDLIAGWLVMARSIGHPEFETIRAEVLETSARKTTSFSAALLECAGAGYGVAPLIDYVSSHLANSNDTFATRSRLVQVGHTSGRALAVGVDMALGLVDQQVNFPKFTSEERAIA